MMWRGQRWKDVFKYLQEKLGKCILISKLLFLALLSCEMCMSIVHIQLLEFVHQISVNHTFLQKKIDIHVLWMCI